MATYFNGCTVAAGKGSHASTITIHSNSKELEKTRSKIVQNAISSRLGHKPTQPMQIVKVDDDDVSYSALFLNAVKAGNFEEMCDIINETDNEILKSKTRRGKSAVYLACEKGHLTILDKLIRLGVSPNVTAKGRRTPLMAAIINAKIDCAFYLLEKPRIMKFDAYDIEGYTALIYAARHGCLAVLRKLLNLGVNVNAQSAEGYSALHNAAYYGKVNCLKELLGHKDIEREIKMKNGVTPFFLAAYSGYIECMHYLHTKETDVNVVNTDTGNTAFIVAANKCDPECLKFLALCENIKVNIQNICYDTAFMVLAGAISRMPHSRLTECLKIVMGDKRTDWTICNFVAKRPIDVIKNSHDTTYYIMAKNEYGMTVKKVNQLKSKTSE